jgi:hypothetical protein
LQPARHRGLEAVRGRLKERWAARNGGPTVQAKCCSHKPIEIAKFSLKLNVERKTERFVFENRPLGDWLLQLLDEDAAKRKTAAKVITNRFYLPRKLLPKTEREVAGFLADFAAAVRKAINTSGFPAADFVQRLLSLDLALQEAWCAKARQDRERENESEPAETAKLRLDWKRITQEEPHEVFITGPAVSWVIQALGEELLPAADLLRKMLFSRDKAHVASEAIARMGRRGLVFYGDLLEGLKYSDPNHYCARALGAILRSVPEKIPEIIRLACDKASSSRIGAITALGACGRKTTDVCPEVETRLRDMLAENAEESVWYAAVVALAETAQTEETVSCLLGHLDHAGPEKTGVIIVALGSIAKAPERVVPRLIELVDAFEEYDPDQSYHGEHERVTHALAAFGPAAASAVPTLIRHIWTRPEQYWTKEKELAERPEPDESIIKLLSELGPLAADALPALLEVQRELQRRNIEETKGDSAPDTGSDSFIDIAIQRIRPDGNNTGTSPTSR